MNIIRITEQAIHKLMNPHQYPGLQAFQPESEAWSIWIFPALFHHHSYTCYEQNQMITIRRITWQRSENHIYAQDEDFYGADVHLQRTTLDIPFAHCRDRLLHIESTDQDIILDGAACGLRHGGHSITIKNNQEAVNIITEFTEYLDHYLPNKNTRIL